jgi:DNA polymerase elongation subunit (family B)
MDFSDRYNNLKAETEDLSKYSLEELELLLKKAKESEMEYDNLQLVVKRNGNSLYGVSASKYYSLHDVDVAEDITLTGKHYAVIVDRSINKFFVNWGIEELNIIRKFYPQITELRKFTEYKPDTINDVCVYGDTDSRYIDIDRIYSLILVDGKRMKLPESDKELADFVTFLMDNFINKIIKDTIEKDCEYRNARKGFLKMNHEITTRKCVFRKKKQYILTAIWENGKLLPKPKLKFKGVELKKGGTAPRAKKILSKLVDKYLLENYSNGQLREECLKLMKYIKSRKEKDFIYLISSVSGLDNISKNDAGIYTSDKNHIQMQIALSWLNFIEKNKLQDLYKPPFEGQKMNYYYCSDNSNFKVIGVPDDVNINNVKGLPEPDWNRMLNAALFKPLLRYIYDKAEIDDVDIEHFLLGVKQWSFK